MPRKLILALFILALLLIPALPATAQSNDDPICDAPVYIALLSELITEYGGRMSEIGSDKEALAEFYFDVMNTRREFADTEVCPALQPLHHWSIAYFTDMQDMTVVVMAAMLNPSLADDYQTLMEDDIQPSFDAHQQNILEAAAQVSE